MKPDRRQVWLVLPLSLAVLPLVPHIPYWVAGIWTACALLRLFRAESVLNNGLRLLIAGLVLLGILAEFRTLIGPQGGIALLVGMSAMKLLETTSTRDRTLMVLIGYFLLMTPFIHDQSLPLAVYLLGVAVLLTGALIAAQSDESVNDASRLQLAAVLLLQALPLALLMFLLFPRLPTPFGGLKQTQVSQTGLSDSMQPGSVSELIQSDAVAFRAEFPGLTPGPGDLYWRGPVLWTFDGQTWRPAEDLPLTTMDSQGDARRINYSITLEPHRQRWLFTLGLPASAPDIPADATPDFQWLAKEVVKTRLRYTHSAFLDYRMDLNLEGAARQLALDLPAGYNPRTRTLVDNWRAQGLTGMPLVERALGHFREEAFYYTLRPPRLGADSVDDFLFGTRRGFCEHYSSAFVVMMRLAGIPARVVTGYQGGEHNALGNYWIVRQRDAHAWAEVWLAGRGWLRIDPTAAVAPERVEHGIEAALPLAERSTNAWDNSLLRPLSQFWDLANTQWNRWVLGYDQRRQHDLLARLHPFLSTLQGMIWAIFLSVGGLLALLFWSLLPRRKGVSEDAMARLHARFRARLRQAGIASSTTDGPLDLARRAIRQRPDLAGDIEAITADYITLRYGHPHAGDWVRLRARIRRFRP
jgi:transglutaminase-like putative cysteine protease